MDYYNDYCISTNSKLKSITDKNKSINQDLRIYNKEDYLTDTIKSLGEVKEIRGHLNIDEITDLGDLIYIQSDLWYSGEKLLSLGNLEKVDGEINLRYSNILSLGKLKYVGKKLNLRDTKINDLGLLVFVGGDLFLPKRLEKLDLNNITVKGGSF